MAKRAPKREAPGATDATALRFRDALPKQISGRVTPETFDQLEALRDTMKTHTGELIRRGVELQIKQLSAEDRRYFTDSLNRLRRRRQSDS